jgi:membrane glycosyltransferase
MQFAILTIVICASALCGGYIAGDVVYNTGISNVQRVLLCALVVMTIIICAVSIRFISNTIVTMFQVLRDEDVQDN